MKYFILFFALVSLCSAATYNLTVSKDNYLRLATRTPLPQGQDYCTPFDEGSTGTFATLKFSHEAGIFTNDLYYDIYTETNIASVPSGSTINFATLYLFATSSSYNGALWAAHQISTGWNETAMCSKEVTVGSEIATGSITNQMVQIDATAAVQSLSNAGTTKLGVRIISNNPNRSGANRIGFLSSKEGTKPGYLIVSTSP